MGVKFDETTVYAFGLRISDVDAASALSGSRRGGRFRCGSREFEFGDNDGCSRRESYSRSKTGRNGLGVGKNGRMEEY